jgi:hypothetical protein
VIETHVNHAELNVEFPAHLQETILVSLGHCNVWLNQINLIHGEVATFGHNPVHELEIERLRSCINVELQELPDVDFFENLRKTCEDDIFFEVLLSEMRNRALGAQSTIEQSVSIF